uniref:Dipeptidyl peptidase 9 n=1 Tax=Ciona savignyi TaxID=51511 RepID=H2Z5L8_CIOSA
TWQEIRNCVRSSRKIHAQFAQKVPHDFIFVPLHCENSTENKNVRLFFLGVPHGQRENTLLYVDIPNNTDNPPDSPLEWKLVFDYFQTLQTDKYSKEEELLRERKRLSIHGITSYQISSDHRYIMFPCGGNIFTIMTEEVGTVGVSCLNFVEPSNIRSSCEGSRMDPKFSPNNSHLISFIHENDLWLTHTESGFERRLTYCNQGMKNRVESRLSAGSASYIVQEEFDRYTGYWWQPNNHTGRVHRILYELVDESDVEVLQIPNPMGKLPFDSYRYPTAGSPNAKVTLQLLEFTCSEDGKVGNVVTRRLSEPLKEAFPWMEYIVRLSWLPNGNGVWAQLLDRAQQETSIVYIPLSRFDHVISEHDELGEHNRHEEVNGADVEMADATAQCNPGLKILYEESCAVWINVHDAFHFMTRNDPDEVRFIWASERSGHRHLYLVKSQLKQTCKRLNTGDRVAVESKACVNSVTQLTSGKWDVLEPSNSMWVDERRGCIYFMGLKDTPLETHLYSVSYDAPGEVTRLTQPGYSHSISMNKDCSMFVSVSSNIGEFFSAKIFNNPTHATPPAQLAELLDPLSDLPEYSPPELFSFVNSCGDKIHGLYHKPSNMEAGRRYPTVLYIYGGPHVQLVTNSFKGLRYQRLFTLSMLGYAVVVIDGRGSSHRGIGFEGCLKNRLGQVEMSDQVEGLQYLAHKFNFIDLSRVAVHGWSYGGYLSLVGLAQRPDIFKVAIAGAPVVNWEKYDTGYTERYLGTPQANPTAYCDSSITGIASKFPNEPNRLLIVHGFIDENVHFIHTIELINALVKCCKPYQLQIYPGERHGIRNPESNEHFEVAVISFLQQNL